jgi:PAS domain S-box-containing protein
VIKAGDEEAHWGAVLAAAAWSAFVVLDVDGHILGWSQGAERLYGWAEHEVIGRPVMEVAIPADHTEAATAILQGLGVPTSPGWEGPFPVKRKDSSVVDVYSRNRPIVVDGRVVAIYSESAPFIPPSARRADTAPPAFQEALTERERDVLRLLPTGMPTPEMAALLHVSSNTLKSHLKSIYRKLGVNSRQAAVVRAVTTNLFRDEPED